MGEVTAGGGGPYLPVMEQVEVYPPVVKRSAVYTSVGTVKAE